MTKTRRMTWAEHLTRMGEKTNVHRILMVKAERKKKSRKNNITEGR
jgi:hypothetical protein